MRIMTCIAGLPIEVAQELQRRSPAKFTGDNAQPPIVRPIKQPYGYRNGMSESYLSELANRLEMLNPKDEVSVLLAYVAYDAESTARFVDCFFPFALSAPLQPFFPNQPPKHERRNALIRYCDEIELAVRSLRERARVVRDVLSGQNFTPLLLPLRNFRSEALLPCIRELYENLGTIDNPRPALMDARNSLLQRYPVQRLIGDRIMSAYFQDDRHLRFRSPGSNRHGMARLVGRGHEPTCLIGSRVRLGGPFDALFHYDCDYEHGRVDRSYRNCHNQETSPAAATHVNIAPNDAVR